MADESKKVEEVKANGATVDWPKKLTLRKAIIDGDGNEVMELIFREPTVEDLQRCGDPARLDYFGGEAKIVYNDAAMAAMMSTLAAVPPSAIKKMHLKDWKNGRLLLTIPFLEDL